MDKRNPLALSVIQTICVVDGSPPGPYDPWDAALPEKLGAPSLDAPPEGVRVDLDKIRLDLHAGLRGTVLHTKLLGRVIEVLSLPEGGKAALMEWTHDYFLMTGQGGSGAEWRESRALLPLTDQEADRIVRIWKPLMDTAVERANAEASAALRRARMNAILDEQGLNADAIYAARNSLLTEAKLDKASVLDRRTEVLLSAGYSQEAIDDCLRFVTFGDDRYIP